MKTFDRACIIGVGLLGGSLAKAMRQRGLVKILVGHGRNRSNLEEAKKLGIIDSFEVDIQSAVKEADLVVLCAPVQAIGPLVRRMAPSLKAGCLVTDVGSVKMQLVREVEPLIPGHAFFVGAHPIAGSEKSGLCVSSETLFEGARCIVTPTEQTDPDALKHTINLWKQVGAHVSCMNVAEHDYILGAVSHLPHVVIYALMNMLGSLKSKNHDEVISFSGSGLKDTTRIAGGDPVMWRDICLSNRDSVLHSIDHFQETLNRIRGGIDRGEGEFLVREFEAANKHRFNLIENA